MKIAIISDTHGNVANFRKVVGWLNKENIKLILHCGDIGNPESLKESLSGFDGEFFGILGNMDKDYKIEIADYQQLPKIRVFEDFAEIEIQQKKIAIIHRPDKTKELAESGKYDLVFYGHTHRPCLSRRRSPEATEGGGGKNKECLIINPGELAGQFYKPCFAVYDTGTDNLELKIVEKLEK